MGEREREILIKLSETLPKLDKDKQNYILGIADGMRLEKERNEGKEKEREVV